MAVSRRSQAERRADTQAALMASAIKLFGLQGYDNTSLEDIGADSGVTIRPIYHYFGNKKQLFAAVNEVVEARVLTAIKALADPDDLMSVCSAFLDLCEEGEFRRIVLLDAPLVLGKARWRDSVVSQRTYVQLGRHFKARDGEGHRGELLVRMWMAALAEAALMIAEASNPAAVRREAEQLMHSLLMPQGHTIN